MKERKTERKETRETDVKKGIKQEREKHRNTEKKDRTHGHIKNGLQYQKNTK